MKLYCDDVSIDEAIYVLRYVSIIHYIFGISPQYKLEVDTVLKSKFRA